MTFLPDIPITISNDLAKVLRSHNIEPQDYQPAYNSMSVGLDLYNAGPTLHIPPGLTNYKRDEFFDAPADQELANSQFKNIFKTLIATGLFLDLPKGWAGIIQERGSITKYPLKIRAGVIDPDYTGQVYVNCVNLASHPCEILHGSKLPFQVVVLQANTNFRSVTQEEYASLTEGSTRKQGMIGSSDKE